MTPPAPVGRSAFLLGFAGLLPQVGAVVLLATSRGDTIMDAVLHGRAAAMASYYAAAILSFLGGMWWGFAMRRDAGQGRLVAVAVLPSLIAVALLVAGEAFWPMRGVLAGLGIAIVATLPVDRHLVATGEAPANWMQLRLPLSVGLVGLTIIAAIFAGR